MPSILSTSYRFSLVIIIASCLVAFGLMESVSTAAENVSPDLAELIGTNAFCVESLPFLRTGVETHQFCSYDRAGDNYDWEYFPLYTDTNGECVIFDAMGPGCLYRHHMNMWAGTPIYKGIQIRYYFDNETKPRIDMDISTFFSTNNPLGIFQAPLAHNGKKRFRLLYHPMFFKQRLKVSLSALPGGPGVLSQPWEGRCTNDPDGHRNHWHWYQYTYQLFNEDPGLDSWTPEAGWQMMPALLSAWNTNFSANDFKSAKGDKEEAVTSRIKAGRTAVLWKDNHAGSIAALRIKFTPTNNTNALYDAWLKITFDGAATPQIEAPLGCFFGAYRTSQKNSYASLLLGYSNNTAFCYFPMPYWKSAVIQIENRGQDKVKVAATIDYQTASAMPYPQENCGYLFAHYYREDPRTEGVDYTYLDISNCSGQVVGHVVGRWGTCMEEDERTYFDGNETPWITGDGYEDDQGMGWGLQNLTLPVFGAVAAKGGSGGVYRFLLPDMYYFNSSIKYGHQIYGPNSPRGFEGLYKVGTEESVTFWYGHTEPRLIQTDEMDIGNSESASAHGYHVEGNVEPVQGNWWYDGEFNNVLFKTPATADSGVSFTNSSTFTVAISPDNRGVRLRRRCDKANNRQEARVYIDGRLVTERPWYSVDYEKTYRGIRWFDSDFEVPKSYTQGKSKITVRIEFVSSQTGRWDEYHYWVYCYQKLLQ